jgi:hypothetical protein
MLHYHPPKPWRRWSFLFTLSSFDSLKLRI